jgi:hypothetical protein
MGKGCMEGMFRAILVAREKMIGVKIHLVD